MGDAAGGADDFSDSDKCGLTYVELLSLLLLTAPFASLKSNASICMSLMGLKAIWFCCAIHGLTKFEFELCIVLVKYCMTNIQLLLGFLQEIC